MTEETVALSKPSADLQENRRIAQSLRTYADLLEGQGDDGFRVRAYENAAAHVDSMVEPLRFVLEEGGIQALVAHPTIGRGIAAAISEILTTGRRSQLERLKGETTPEKVFQTIPGIGKVLADRFAVQLDAQTLEELEALLRNPKVSVPGLGSRRRDAILAALSERLEPIRRIRRGSHGAAKEPPVALLLEADAIYRRKAVAGELRRIAPRRLNPGGEEWLPILHLRRADWHLTLLYSNTARAHELQRTRDWVVVFFHFSDGPESQRTIVTQRAGMLAGKRVVRGREDECARYYEEMALKRPS